MAAYALYFATVAAIFAIATLGLNLQWGIAGQFNAGVVGFMAVGAYTMAIVSMPASPLRWVHLEWPFALALCAAMAVTAAVAALVALATLRLRGDYLAIATFGVASAIQLLANNLEPLTGGSRGLIGFARPFAALGPHGFALAYAAIVFGSLALAWLALRALLRSPWGRLQRALRDDEVACAALGKPVLRHRVESFVLGAVLMGMAGALYAGFVGTASPGDFAPIVTFQIWAMLIVGGSGSLAGAVLGSFVIWGLWTGSGIVIVEVLPPKWQTQGGALQATLVGVVLVAVLLWRPAGLLGARLSLAPRRQAGIMRVGPYDKEETP